jgi:GNAT superfamily N-acetyltransferase
MIRPASPEEAPLLSSLAFRSKAYWGYAPDLMALCRPYLTYEPAEVARGIFYVWDEPPLRGFYRLVANSTPYTITLEDLFIDPEAIGAGIGSRLFQHAAAYARAQGKQWLVLEADPHAAGFYRKQGMEQCGERPSDVFPNQALLLMRLKL